MQVHPRTGEYMRKQSHPGCNSGMEQDGVENVNFRFVQTGELWADRKDESLEKDDKTR